MSGASKNRGSSARFFEKIRNIQREYCRTHTSKSSLGNDIQKSYLASFAQEYSGEFITPPFYGFTFF
ncbi:hypothetical protein Hanom_Chr11g01020911 [Helianthus anomalus]